MYFMVGNSYQSLKQRSLQKLRENKKIYWNLIYYFSRNGLPYEFLIPYQSRELFEYTTKEFDLRSKMTLLQQVEAEGIEAYI